MNRIKCVLLPQKGLRACSALTGGEERTEQERKEIQRIQEAGEERMRDGRERRGGNKEERKGKVGKAGKKK